MLTDLCVGGAQTFGPQAREMQLTMSGQTKGTALISLISTVKIEELNADTVQARASLPVDLQPSPRPPHDSLSAHTVRGCSLQSAPSPVLGSRGLGTHPASHPAMRPPQCAPPQCAPRSLPLLRSSHRGENFAKILGLNENYYTPGL